MRSAFSAGGGRSTNCDNSIALPVHVESQSSATLVNTTNQPRPRRGSISRAPTSIKSSSGTGGNISAAKTGFQDSIWSKAKRLFTVGGGGCRRGIVRDASGYRAAQARGHHGASTCFKGTP